MENYLYNSYLDILYFEQVEVIMEKRQKGLEATYKKYDSEMNGFYHMDLTPVTGPSQTTSPTSSNMPTVQPTQLKQDKEEGEASLLSVPAF